MHTGRAGMELLGREVWWVQVGYTGLELLGREVWCIQVGQVWNCLVERYGVYR